MTTIADDNTPYKRLVEQTEASVPNATAGGYNLFIDSSDHLVKKKDSSGTVTEVGSSAGSGLTLLEQHTASTSASLDFTTCITSTYDEYLVEIVRVVAATNTASLQARVSTDGGSTWDSTAAHYQYSVYIAVSNAAAATGSDSATSWGITGGSSSNAALGGVNGSIRLYDPLNASSNKIMGGLAQCYGTSNSKIATWFPGGSYLQTTAYNAIQFFFSSGNIASGTIRIYGIAK